MHGALPEQEYLDLVNQAGFTGLRATRSQSGGTVEDIQVYSLSISAYKGEPSAGADAANELPAATDIMTLTPAARKTCC